MRIDVVDVEVDDIGIEPMASFAMSYLAQQRRSYVMFLETDTWQSLISHIINCSHGRGTIDILQIHSHGTPGTMFSGRLNENNAAGLVGVFSTLAHYFGSSGQVYLKGCTTGQRPGLLHPLARAFGVPVTAGVQDQFVGGAITDTYVGTTVTALPNDNHFHLNYAGVPRSTLP